MWKAFHAQVSDRLAAAGIPLAVTPGNHDGSAYEGFELERSIYREQWTPRNPGVHFIDKAGYPLYYAFTVGDSLFISLDATTVGHLPRAQMDWLRTILAEYGAERQRRVVFSHVPLWPFTRGRERESIGDPELEALLAAADVDLYLSGHHHAFYPGVKDGIAFVSQSCLGAGPRRLIGAQNKSGRGFTWLEFTDSETRIAAYQGPKFESTIDWETLPPRIHGVGGDMVRADLAPGVITPLGPTGSQ
jgi:3',5'-cyclic AMP phosphodiesterase CpdA